MAIFFAVLAALIVFFYFPLILSLLWAARYIFLALLIGLIALCIPTLYQAWQANEQVRQQTIQYQQTHSVR